MSLAEWVAEFRGLHEKAHKGQLTPRDKTLYRSGRDELARALLAAQRLTLKPGETPRQALRVARALQVDIDSVTNQVRAMTIDISTGGFGCLLAKALPVDSTVNYSLRLPGADPLKGEARVVEVRQQPGNVRASFAFERMGEADRERMELFIFDTVLAQMSG